jgi:hypothetical protein
MPVSLEKTAYIAGVINRAMISDTNAVYAKMVQLLNKMLKVEGVSSTAAAINALTDPMPGLLVTITTGGTLTLGSLVVVTDDTVYFNESIWVKAEWVQNVDPVTAFLVDDTLTAAESGVVFLVGADAKTATLPSSAAVGAGVKYAFVNNGADGAYGFTVAVNAVDKLMGSFSNGRTKITMSGTDDKNIVNTKSTANNGDYLIIESDGVNGWYIIGGSGIWTEESQVPINENPKVIETVTEAKTLTIADSGKTFILNGVAGAEIALPAVATSAGFYAKFIVGAAIAATDWTIFAATAVIQGAVIVDSTHVPGVDEDTISFVVATAVAGDYVELECDGTNWYVSGSGEATGSITLTDAA